MYRYIVALVVVVAACDSKSGPAAAPVPGESPGAAVEPTAAAPATPTDGQRPPDTASSSPEQKTAALTRVEPSKVCMVNNQYMGQQQIPVALDGKTYFGCCPMCKGRLESDPTSRVANDPLSGKVVDKAVAVIAKNDSGRVYYFEDEQNLERFRAQR